MVRRDRSLMVFPVFGGLAGLVVLAIFGGGGAGLYASTDSEPAAIVVLVVGAYVLIALSIFCNVALTACATRSLEGEDTTPGEGFAAARGRLGPIFGWAGLQLVVGGLINLAQMFLREGAGQIVGAVIGGLANLAWSVATFFVIPIIALEGLGPKAALKRSLAVVRERWGEGVTGTFAIGGLVFLVAFLPGAVLIGIGIGLTSSAGVAAGILIGVGAAVCVIGAVVQTALLAIFKVALYRYATEDRVFADFDRDELSAAFRPRRGRPPAI